MIPSFDISKITQKVRRIEFLPPPPVSIIQRNKRIRLYVGTALSPRGIPIVVDLAFYPSTKITTAKRQEYREKMPSFDITTKPATRYETKLVPMQGYKPAPVLLQFDKDLHKLESIVLDERILFQTISRSRNDRVILKIGDGDTIIVLGIRK